MQEAFQENHGLQCGFCTPGMVMSAIEIVTKNKNAVKMRLEKALKEIFVDALAIIILFNRLKPAQKKWEGLMNDVRNRWNRIISKKKRR